MLMLLLFVEDDRIANSQRSSVAHYDCLAVVLSSKSNMEVRGSQRQVSAARLCRRQILQNDAMVGGRERFRLEDERRRKRLHSSANPAFPLSFGPVTANLLLHAFRPSRQGRQADQGSHACYAHTAAIQTL